MPRTNNRIFGDGRKLYSSSSKAEGFFFFSKSRRNNPKRAVNACILRRFLELFFKERSRSLIGSYGLLLTPHELMDQPLNLLFCLNQPLVRKNCDWIRICFLADHRQRAERMIVSETSVLLSPVSRERLEGVPATRFYVFIRIPLQDCGYVVWPGVPASRTAFPSSGCPSICMLWMQHPSPDRFSTVM